MIHWLLFKFRVLRIRPLTIAVMVTVIAAGVACAPAGEPPLPGEPGINGVRPTDFPRVVDPAVPSPTRAATLQPGQAPEIQPAIPERRRLTLEFPPRIRVGDSDILRLSLEMDTLGNVTPTAQFGGNEIRSDLIEIPNLYETHNVLAEARLDILGLDISPQGTQVQALQPGQSVVYSWSLLPREVGDHRGTAWLFLRFIPRDGGAESQRPISAQVVEIHAVNFLGLGGAPARLLGGLGTVLGSLLGLDDIIKWLRRRKDALK